MTHYVWNFISASSLEFIPILNHNFSYQIAKCQKETYRPAEETIISIYKQVIIY